LSRKIVIRLKTAFPSKRFVVPVAGLFAIFNDFVLLRSRAQRLRSGRIKCGCGRPVPRSLCCSAMFILSPSTILLKLEATLFPAGLILLREIISPII
jgi:hypothetical protein